jgi:hypothetical protein
VAASSALGVFLFHFGEVFLVRGLAGYSVAAIEPAPEIDELAALRAERTEPTRFGFHRLFAGRTAHEPILESPARLVHIERYTRDTS